jgi:hypothetical protein
MRTAFLLILHERYTINCLAIPLLQQQAARPRPEFVSLGGGRRVVPAAMAFALPCHATAWRFRINLRSRTRSQHEIHVIKCYM